MNITRTISLLRHQNFGRTLSRNFRFSASNYEASQNTQPKVQDDKFDFEDLKVLERIERRKAKIPPFMKDVFVSVFNRELLAYPEIINKDESEALENRLSVLEKVFSDSNKTRDDRKEALKRLNIYSGGVNIPNGGLSMNVTEGLRYLETTASDIQLSQELSDHWVAIEALKTGLPSEQFQQIVDDLVSGDRTVAICIKEKISERLSQPDFKTTAELDGQGIWRISGEKVCHNVNGYFLVLCSVEGNRIMGFLVHPKAHGVNVNDVYVSFNKTIATPLSNVTEQQLALSLSLSRLHAACLARGALTKAVTQCCEYVHSRTYGGKPLSELSTIRATIGDALLSIYASESAEYFTAGLMDGYMEPEADMEAAMCRNFMATHAMPTLLKLLAIPSIETQEQSAKAFEEMRELTLNGETLESVNMFIALNGIHHAGKSMAEEIKQIRNPLLHPTFIFRKVLANRHQERDQPKLTLYLAEHLHPTLRPPAEQLEYCVLRMKFACETMMSRHGMDITTAYTELTRLAEAATEILVMSAVLARASRAYCIGLRNAEVDMKLAACFVDRTKEKVKKLILEIDDGEFLNLDHFRIEFGRKVLDTKSTIVERPVARTFW